MLNKITDEGYVLVYVPDHPYCMKSTSYRGWAYEHRYVVEVHIGRRLRRSEHVHHKDGNKLNNVLSNLDVLSGAEHQAIHHPANVSAPVYCRLCGTLCTSKDSDTFCSLKCAHEATRKVARPSKELLLQHVSDGIPATKIGKMYGVSDNAVRKWARLYGII